MKKIDLNFELKDLSGQPLQGVSIAGQIIANLLASETDGDAVKFYDWAIILYKKEPINVDDSDFTKIKVLIDTSNKITILAKGPILKYLESIK